jgi:hypothetical protein
MNKRKTIVVEYTAPEFYLIEPHLKRLGWGRTNINRPYNSMRTPYVVTYLYPADLTLLKLKYNV